MLIRLWQASYVYAAQFALQLLCGEFSGCRTAAPSLSPSVSLPLCPSLSVSLLVLARVVFSFVCFQCSAGNVAGNVSLSLTVLFFSNGRAVCYGFIFFATRTRNYNFSFNLSCVFLGKHYDNTWGQSPRLASGQTAASGCLSSRSLSLSLRTPWGAVFVSYTSPATGCCCCCCAF